MVRNIRFNCILFFVTLLLSLWPAARADANGQKLVVLCYHDVILTPADYVLPDTVPILAQDLANHFDWLKANGYTVVSLSDVVEADKGGKPLPEKAVLLTFDDGYSSAYTTVFPMLKAYNYPAVFALHTGWLETPVSQPVQYSHNVQLPRKNFITWEQAREMARSGLVELASHSHDMHRNIQGNPQGNMMPEVEKLKFFPETGRYQTEQEFYAMVRSDFKRSADIIAAKTGQRPRLAVWPYGRYTEPGLRAVAEAGYLYSAALRQGYTTLKGPGKTLIERCMIDTHDKNLADVFRELRDKKRQSLQRVVHVDLDYLYDPNPAQTERNISQLLDRLKRLQINTVYLQAFADPDGNGTADQLYFPNRHLPVRADLFSRVSNLLNNKLGLSVYAWMPILGFEVPDQSLYIQAVARGKEGSTYKRLSPFNPQARQIIREIYYDLAKASPLQGILFHDDGIIGDYEDASQHGTVWLARKGLPKDLESHQNEAGLRLRAGKAKGDALIAFTRELADVVRQWRPFIHTARNIYADVILNPESEAWMAQNYNDFLNAYDYTAVMAMPYMHKADNPQAWLDRLAEKVTTFPHPAAKAKTLFELQTVDWNKGNRPIDSKTLAEQMYRLQTKGIRHIGYYPDDFARNHPDISTIFPSFSLKANEFIRN